MSLLFRDIIKQVNEIGEIISDSGNDNLRSFIFLFEKYLIEIA